MERWLRPGPDAAGLAADPGRVHTEGRVVRALVEEARHHVAALVGTSPRQVIFTSGGTEAINAAVWGATRAAPGRPVVVAGVEHSAVRQSSLRLAPVVAWAVDDGGRVDPDALDESLRRQMAAGDPPALVHCQAANHEVGTLQPLAAVAAVCHRHGIPLHVDACMAMGHLPLAFDELGADLMSVSAHKCGGPPGAGALVVRRGRRFDPLLVGGEQERDRRAGLENVPGLLGFGAAADVLTRPGVLEAEAEAARRQRDDILATARAVDGVAAVGDPRHRLPHLVCLTVAGVEAEAVLLGLDQRGIAAHSGSSCSSESLEPSPVLEAMGVDAERSLRLSVGWSTTADDVAAFSQAFAPVVEGLRRLGA